MFTLTLTPDVVVVVTGVSWRPRGRLSTLTVIAHDRVNGHQLRTADEQTDDTDRRTQPPPLHLHIHTPTEHRRSRGGFALKTIRFTFRLVHLPDLVIFVSFWCNFYNACAKSSLVCICQTATWHCHVAVKQTACSQFQIFSTLYSKSSHYDFGLL